MSDPECESIYSSASSRVFDELLPDDVGWVNRYALGNLVCAEAMISGTDQAMNMAHDRIAQFKLSPADSFGVWADLLKQGVKDALPFARRDAGIVGEPTFLEILGAVDVRGLHSAERLVELVEAGDVNSIPQARATTQNIWSIDRTALLAKLYEAGDDESRDLAIASAQEAKAYCNQTGDTHYNRSETALYAMALHAANNGNAEDAELLAGHLEGSVKAGSIYMALCKQGQDQFIPKVIGIINSSDASPARDGLIRQLAATGHPEAIKIIKKWSLPRRLRKDAPDADLDNLVVLHNLGFSEAADRVDKLVSMRNPRYYLSYLGAVGLTARQLELAEGVFKEDPTYTSAQDIMYAEFTVPRWKRTFDMAMEERPDAWQRSGDIKYLATQVTA